MGHTFGFFGCVWALLVIGVIVYPVWRICEKIGYPGPAGLLIFVPVVNLIVIWVLALSDWPIEQQLRASRGQPPAYPGAPPVG